MALATHDRPDWLTFDCSGALIRWDDGLKAVARQAASASRAGADTDRVVETYDRHESELERDAPFKRFGRWRLWPSTSRSRRCVSMRARSPA